MTWKLEGDWIESCSCTVTCPCNLNQDPTKGHCDVSFVFAIRDGEANGIDVGGVNVVWTVNLPGNFMGGNATARLYIDESASEEQQRELETIFTGKAGGAWEPLSGIVSKWMPTMPARIEVTENTVSVGDFGRIVVEPITDDAGRRPILHDPPLLTFLGIKEFECAKATTGKWEDPEMKAWETGGHAGRTTFAWQG